MKLAWNLAFSIVPLVMGCAVLISNMEELRFYSMQSPFVAAFLLFGISLGVFLMVVAESDAG